MRIQNGQKTAFLKASTRRMRRWRADPSNRRNENERSTRLRQILKGSEGQNPSAGHSGVDTPQKSNESRRTKNVREGAFRGPFLTTEEAASNDMFLSCR